jgi:hypothetical protein
MSSSSLTDTLLRYASELTRNCSYRHFVIGMEPNLMAYSSLVNQPHLFNFYYPFTRGGWIVTMILCMIQLSFLSKIIYKVNVFGIPKKKKWIFG